MLYNRKSVINFNLLLVFVGKTKFNFHYKKMTEKMYFNLQEKYKSSDFQILKIWKAFSNFDFNWTIRQKYTGVCNCLEIKLDIQIHSSTYSVSI